MRIVFHLEDRNCSPDDISERRSTQRRGEGKAMSNAWRENGLSIVLFGLFLAFLVAQSLAGHRVEVAESREHGEPPPSYGDYLTSGGFAEATFENWESEFL